MGLFSDEGAGFDMFDDPDNPVMKRSPVDNGSGMMEGRHLGSATAVGYRPETLESPVEALDMHLRQWEWMSTQDAQWSMESFLRAYKHGRLESEAKKFVRVVEDVLDQAITTYVTPDVADLLFHQGQAMPPDMVQPTDVPYPVGFLVLAEPWWYMDFDIDCEGGDTGRKIPVRAIAWWESETIEQPDGGDIKPGLMIALYADFDWIKTISKGATDAFASKPALFLADLWAWTYDTWWKDADLDEEGRDQHHASHHVGEMRRVLLTAWRFMQEEIIRTERFKPSRPATRRWNRANIANIPEDGCITTLHLRRYAQKHNATPDEEREARERCWSHRWWVEGHYRYCKKCGIDHPKHKHQWVRPYIKGPQDAPLVLKERLVAVSR